MRTTLSLPVLVGLSLLVACNGSSDASGRTGPDGETGQRSVEGRVAGDGAATVTVEDADSAQPLGSAEVGADGRYTVEFEGGASPVVITAFDASGAVVGAVLVDGRSSFDEVTVAAPIDAETTLEAEVAFAIADLSGSLEGVNTVDMRGRVSAAFAGPAAAAGDADAAISALAMAEIAATEAADLALSSNGSAFGAAARLDASLTARQAFDVALDAGEVEAEAQAAFDAAVADAWAAEGVSMSVAADADTAARAAFESTLDAGSGSLSARFATAAVMEALADADADAETTAGAEAAGRVLIEAMLAGEASGPAWSAWAETWLGGGEVASGLLGDTLAIGAETVNEADALVSGASDAAETFSAEVKASASAAIAAGAGGEASVASLAGGSSWQAYAVFRAEVEGSVQAASTELVDGKVSATTELLVRAAAAAALSEGAE